MELQRNVGGGLEAGCVHHADLIFTHTGWHNELRYFSHHPSLVVDRGRALLGVFHQGIHRGTLVVNGILPAFHRCAHEALHEVGFALDHDHDALPAAKMGGAVQVPGPRMEVEWSAGIADTKQGYLRPDGRCPIGHIQRLGAGLRGDGDGQSDPPVQLLGLTPTAPPAEPRRRCCRR